ncbi:MAG TPA: heme-binding domain-containing protein [Bacteroidia bacterium]|jgi:hypothetical protein|nr:heme-binding domain-containing protein [Bacteroidia bacterium]
MNNVKKLLYILVVLLLGIQLIRPEKNEGEVYGKDDISHAVNVPAEVKNILERSCNDCHSDRTNYPWYINIQPVGWWLNHHVEEGKNELNFSTFNTYKLRRKLHKLEDIAEQVKEGEMPMGSYTRMHKNAELNDAEKQVIINWALDARALLDTMKIAQ